MLRRIPSLSRSRSLPRPSLEITSIGETYVSFATAPTATAVVASTDDVIKNHYPDAGRSFLARCCLLIEVVTVMMAVPLCAVVGVVDAGIFVLFSFRVCHSCVRSLGRFLLQ